MFSEFSQYLKKLEETPSRNSMTEILADLFRHAKEGEIGKLCYLLQGRVAPLYEAVEFGVADKFMIRAIAEASGVSEKKVNQKFKKSGDLGIVAQACHAQTGDKGDKGNRGDKGELNIFRVYEALRQVTKESGEGSQDKKITLLAELLQSVDPLSARFIARIPLDKLRLGFSDMTILDALSWMLVGGKSLRDTLEEAYNVRPDIGYLSDAVKSFGIKGLSHVKVKVGAPILASLCQRLPTADEMIKKMGEVAVEPKYDGVRVQIHYEKSKVKSQKSKVITFSRNLENTTAMFPELQHIGNQLNATEVILDGEAIGVDPKTGKLIPFQETMTRKRKHEIALALKNVPLKFYIFDILYRDGKELLNTPLSERRTVLEQVVKKGDLLVISPQIITSKASDIRRYHDEQINKGLEGAVVKKWKSPYEPGRRGFSWVKFKEEEGKTGKLTDTIDGVVMGYYRGEGKRSGFGIGAFLVGVKKGEHFVTITKIGTGVSDALWKELRTELNTLKANQKPKEYADIDKMFLPDVWVSPKLVIELAGDDLTKSKTHGAGVAVRFPRLVRIRRDKSPQDVTSVAEIRRMYTDQ